MPNSVMSAPAALVVAKIMYPERAEPETGTSLHVDVESLRPVGRLGLDEYTMLGDLRRVPRPQLPTGDG